MEDGESRISMKCIARVDFYQMEDGKSKVSELSVMSELIFSFHKKYNRNL